MSRTYQLRVVAPLSSDLTRRERQVLKIRSRGIKREAVALMLGLSVKAIDFHSTNAYRKLGVNCLQDAIREYFQTLEAA